MHTFIFWIIMADDYTCLLVDVDHGSLEAEWEAHAQASTIPFKVVIAKNADDALSIMQKHYVIFLVVFASDYSRSVDSLIRMFQRKVGSMPELQVIVCNEPSPLFLASTFEFGIEQIVAKETWLQECTAYTQRAALMLAEKDSPELQCVHAIRALATGDHTQFERLEKKLATTESYHYLAAYTRGKLLEASGLHAESLKAYQKANRLNSLFRPAQLAKGEAMIALGDYAKAAELLETLEQTNPQNVDCKLSLATAYCQLGKEEQAAVLLAQASRLSPSAPRLLEAKVYYLLTTQQIKEALSLIDQLEEVGPNLASKINDLGIKLSQAGKGKSALLLYRKAHKIVRPDLRYKISLNAALACRRSGELAMALKYCARAQQEYGGPHPKLQKIEDNIRAAMSKLGAAS